MMASTMKAGVKALFGLAVLSLCGSALAQLRVEISGVGANQIPVAIANFADEGTGSQKISAIVREDLQRSGLFRILDAGTMSETMPVNYADWKARGADALAAGSVLRLVDGRLDVRYKLFDTIKGSQLSALNFADPASSARVVAHKIADDIFEKLTGSRGAFATRIAYVTKSGPEYRLEVADADGEGTAVALRSSEPIISPAWSPDGTRVAYVSFEAKKPVVYVQDLTSRRRTIVANFKGNNSAPAWSPDGRRLAVALSRDGGTHVFSVNTDGTGLQKLSDSNGIDTEPQYSPDGQSIYFTSDRSGGPQIYRMPAGGGAAQRVTFNGSYNITPRISPDGKTLAYISRRDGRFQLYSLDLASGQELRLSDTAKDESPSFSPNGKYLMYATESGRRGTLGVVSTDGRVRYKLTTQAGDVREPTWGPFMK
ncbi:MAG: tolB [Paucimonas sp.]|nr:tolB [Paucimonas sp.]